MGFWHVVMGIYGGGPPASNTGVGQTHATTVFRIGTIGVHVQRQTEASHVQKTGSSESVRVGV